MTKKGAGTPDALGSLSALTESVSNCRRCPRLVEWRERVARDKRAAFVDEQYWGRPVPGFGDPLARVAQHDFSHVGLALAVAEAEVAVPEVPRR